MPGHHFQVSFKTPCCCFDLLCGQHHGLHLVGTGHSEERNVPGCLWPWHMPRLGNDMSYHELILIPPKSYLWKISCNEPVLVQKSPLFGWVFLNRYHCNFKFNVNSPLGGAFLLPPGVEKELFPSSGGSFSTLSTLAQGEPFLHSFLQKPLSEQK